VNIASFSARLTLSFKASPRRGMAGPSVAGLVPPAHDFRVTANTSTVGELGIEREAELGEEGRGSLKVFDRQVEEDLGGHHGSLSKIGGRVVGLPLPGN
jgi:hypothetical protein